LSKQGLDGFYDWLRQRGRSEETATKYRGQVKLARDSDRLTDRIVRDELAPNTRRFALASLRAWAKYTQDGALVAQLDDLKLPPPENVIDSQPLAPKQWRALRKHIAADVELAESERAALLMIARRGLRVGGVAALTRKALVAASNNGVLIFLTKGRTLRYGVGPVREQIQQLAAIGGKWTILADVITPNAAHHRQIRATCKRLWTLLSHQADAVGIDEMYPHRLRHTCATEFYKKTKDIKALQEYMQWADIKTAARYVTHMRREELDQVAEEILDD
jgi:site-specific recombinase XerD